VYDLCKLKKTTYFTFNWVVDSFNSFSLVTVV